MEKLEGAEKLGTELEKLGTELEKAGVEGAEKLARRGREEVGEWKAGREVNLEDCSCSWRTGLCTDLVRWSGARRFSIVKSLSRFPSCTGVTGGVRGLGCTSGETQLCCRMRGWVGVWGVCKEENALEASGNALEASETLELSRTVVVVEMRVLLGGMLSEIEEKLRFRDPGLGRS